MPALDCESKDSTLASMADIYGVHSSEIQDFVLSFDIDEHFAIHDPPRGPGKELVLLFEKQFGCELAPLEKVFWFHLTRASSGADFTKGIQPLAEVLNGVWETLLLVFRGTHHEGRLKALRTQGVPNHAYALKLSSPVHGGPYAMLVRASAFRDDEMGNHDYLWLPEIMEDICNGYHVAYGELIHEDLRSALTSFVVKFWSRKQMGIGCIASAMYYLYCTAHNRLLTIDANTCYDGGNASVPPEQIINVEAPNVPDAAI